MPNQSYAIWNNKGGVGKSTITFHLAVRYAELNPEKKVLVVDMCPQANSSMMLLGGGRKGEQKVLELCQESVPPTVVGYLADFLSKGEGAPQGDVEPFIVNVNAVNNVLPKNLFLLCGDGNLEPMAPLISERARQAALTPAANPWLWVHSTIKRFIEAATKEQEWLVLVDTNPSFSIYTEIAISSVNKLIVPVNADDASRLATNAMFTLIYGAEPPHPIYGKYTYAKLANDSSLERPKIHLIVGNRLTQYAEGDAAAFRAISVETANSLFEAYRAQPQRFTPLENEQSIGTMEQFRDTYSITLRDFNTAGIVAAHQGQSLANLRDGTYRVYASSVTVNAARVKECRDAVDAVVARL
jgi:cellulose biosynthesis protein BcsQ